MAHDMHAANYDLSLTIERDAGFAAPQRDGVLSVEHHRPAIDDGLARRVSSLHRGLNDSDDDGTGELGSLKDERYFPSDAPVVERHTGAGLYLLVNRLSWKFDHRRPGAVEPNQRTDYRSERTIRERLNRTLNRAVNVDVEH